MTPSSDGSDGVATEDLAQAISAADRALDALTLVALRQVAVEVSGGEFTVLRRLAAEPTPRISDLSLSLSMAPSTLTRYCDRLSALDLLTRTRDPRDRREIKVTLTPRGRALVRSVVRRRDAEAARRLETLSNAERRTLLRLATRLAEAARGAEHAPKQASA